MKRKIAILLSAMMVTSAMPMTASAAHLKSDGVLNSTFAKANETIDANAKGEEGYISHKTVNDLKGRKSVLKIALKDDGTNNISGETTFKVELENGTFDTNNKALYQYVNTNGTERISYEQAMGLDGVRVKAKDLKGVYANIAKNTTTTTTKVDQDVEIKSETDAYKKLDDAIKALKESDFSTSAGGTNSEANAIKDKATFMEYPTIKPILDELRTAIIAEKTVVVPQLAHIPYDITIDSPTSATVKVPDLNFSDADKKINMGQTKNPTVEFFFGTSTGTSSGTTETSNFNWSTIGSGGSGKIEKVYAKVTENTTDDVNVENPYIALPLGAVIADGSAPVKAKITSDYNDKVVGGEYTLTSSVQEGDTELVYNSNNIKAFEDYGKLGPVVIKENVRNTIGTLSSNYDEATLTLRLNGGFKFKDKKVKLENGKEEGIKIYNDKTGEELKYETIKTDNQSVLKVKITGLNGKDGKDKSRTLPIGIRFENLFVEANNSKNFGEVELHVSGDGITSQSKVVAKRSELGFKLETLKDPMEIISGRHYKAEEENNKKNQIKNANMSEKDNTTVEVKFSESIPNTLVESRALDFFVPEGVKIVGAEIRKQNNFTDKPEVEDFEIIENGKVLRLKRDEYIVKDNKANTNILANFVLKLDLSVEPGFKGDIKLGVTGGGQSNVTEVVVAKAVVPFEIKTTTTKANIGYQDYNTADIVITEARPGMFLENEYASLYLKAPFAGNEELGFSNAKFEISGGELEVKEKDFGVKDGSIRFKVNKSSYKNPSTITIKNVKIGTTRSVPFGAYDLLLSGNAVINNFKSEVKDDGPFKIDAKSPELFYQDKTPAYKFERYLDVITETGTFDQVVKVSVGEKTILLGDQAIDMDVAPYIQASSNSTMVPLRFVSVALGVDTANAANADESSKIAFDANTKTTTIYYGAGTGQKIIQFQAGSNIMTVDGTKIPMEFGVKAEIKDGRMFVPFRALGQALGVTVDWDADTRTAIYNKDHGRNAKMTETTTESTTASTTTTETTTESTTASDTTTETTTAKN